MSNYDVLPDSRFLRGKNVGCSVKLRGKVVLVVFLVDDTKSRWDDASHARYEALIRKICLRLMAESGLPKEQLHLTYAISRASVPYVVNQTTMRQMMTDVLESYRCGNTEAFQKLYEDSFQRDDACITFVLNRDFRSFAQRINARRVHHRGSYPHGDEYSVVSYRRFDLKRSEHSFVHELMHQFGATDYYTDPQIEQAAQTHLPGSIMNGGDRIDPLTRYVIGWDDQLDPKALAFLKQIEGIETK